MKKNLEEARTTLLDIDVRTRVELSNETVKESGRPGEAGKVALIGAFPSTSQDVYSCTSLRALQRHYSITPGTKSETEFDGARAAKRIFMDGINGYSGATTVTCVNISDETLDTNNLSATVTSGNTTSADVTSAIKLTWDKLIMALNKINDDDMDVLFIASDLRDAVDDDHDLEAVYDKVIGFVNNKFIMQRPTYVVAPVVCTEDISGGQPDGIPSTTIQVTESERDGKKIPGAEQVANCFNTATNELTTAGLFCQGGKITNNSKTDTVDVMEMAAHMVGWMCSLPVSQDLTYQDIPGVTGISEELYLGEDDAGEYLNKCGIQVIKPKSRTNNIFCVNNSVNPSGWHTNHVRSVAYLLKQYGLEAGLGLNNFENNLDAFKANLNNVTNTVLQNVDLITNVEIGDIELIEPYEIYVPIQITLAGVITLIKVGVNMVLANSTEESEEE